MEMLTIRLSIDSINSACASSYSYTHTTPSVTPPLLTGSEATEKNAPEANREPNICLPSSAYCTSRSRANLPSYVGISLS